jgi:hypothetical protein
MLTLKMSLKLVAATAYAVPVLLIITRMTSNLIWRACACSGRVRACGGASVQV